MKKGYILNYGDVVLSHFYNKNDFVDICRDGCHDKYEIIFAISPLGIFTVEGKSYHLTPRNLLLIAPMSYHNHIPFDVEECEGYSILFSKHSLADKIIPMLDRISAGSDDSGRFYSSDCLCDVVSNIFTRFEDIMILPENERKAFVEIIISELIIFLSAADGLLISRNDHELGARVAKYLNSNIEKNISLDKLAARFFVSKYHLCRAFKKYSGTSVHSYINHKRIIYAKQLIESGEKASGAAERVGFGDYSAFYRAYVRIVGNSPSKN